MACCTEIYARPGTEDGGQRYLLIRNDLGNMPLSLEVGFGSKLRLAPFLECLGRRLATTTSHELQLSGPEGRSKAFQGTLVLATFPRG
jgi:hypothetical protein